MKPLPPALLIIAVLVGAMFYAATTVQAYAYKSGSITQDTTWTKDGGPYRLTSYVSVPSGVTLTIEPGTVVDFYYYSLQVAGTLNCRGTGGDRIVLFSSAGYGGGGYLSLSNSTSWNENQGTGSIVEYTVLSGVYMSVDVSSPKISNNYFTAISSTALSIFNGASPLVANNAFNSQGTGIYVSNGSPTICNNFIKSTSNYGIQVYGNASIYGNNITSCATGITLALNSNTTITSNLITSNSVGINSSTNSTIIESNIITNNTNGIVGAGAIRYNTIGNNSCGFMLSASPRNISQNTITNNTVNVRLTASNIALGITNNWWNSTDPTSISGTMQVTQPTSSITFMPFLEASNPLAPSTDSLWLVPAPTPTPFVNPSPVPPPSPSIYPTYTPQPTPVITAEPMPPPTQPTSPPTATPTPLPTPIPTPKIVPGSPLSVGSASFEELLSQLDIMSLAQLVLVALTTMWIVIILGFVARKAVKKAIGKTENQP